ncbi:hypothetical protein EDC01DRAFT_644245 [Geopyxis carbonaria]|nr:hypothetical protein EDC01DRAFT_644245 [Geopyxis carbonaria]
MATMQSDNVLHRVENSRKPIRKLNMIKCEHCRASKKLCKFSNGPWPSMCDRCVERGLNCPEPKRAGGRTKDLGSSTDVADKSGDEVINMLVDMLVEPQEHEVSNDDSRSPVSKNIPEFEKSDDLSTTPMDLDSDSDSDDCQLASPKASNSPEKDELEEVEAYIFDLFRQVLPLSLNTDIMNFFLGNQQFGYRESWQYFGIAAYPQSGQHFVLNHHRLDNFINMDNPRFRPIVGPSRVFALRTIIPYMVTAKAANATTDNVRGVRIRRTLKSLLYNAEVYALRHLWDWPADIDLEIFYGDLLWCWNALGDEREHRLRILPAMAHYYEKKGRFEQATETNLDLLRDLIKMPKVSRYRIQEVTDKIVNNLAVDEAEGATLPRKPDVYIPEPPQEIPKALELPPSPPREPVYTSPQFIPVAHIPRGLLSFNAGSQSVYSKTSENSSERNFRTLAESLYSNIARSRKFFP